MKVTIGNYPEDCTLNRVEDVHIDEWDTWNMAETLALIITPMLKQLKETTHGSPYVDPDDVPAELKPTTTPSDDNNWVDDTHHERWEYVLSEMHFAMEALNTDWDAPYWSGESDYEFKECENGMSEMVEGPNHTLKCDWDGYNKHNDRIQNGCRLFGKYFRNLWD